MSNPHQVTRDFERELCAYTGAPYAVAVNSCTAALRLCFDWLHYTQGPKTLSIPRRTYPSVAWQALQAGHLVEYHDAKWTTWYTCMGSYIVDAAHHFAPGMYSIVPGQSACISFHAQKPLGLEQGGAILHDSEAADAFYRMARFDGRREGVPVARDTFEIPVRYRHHCYMNPSTAALGLQRLYALTSHDRNYPDVSALRQGAV